MQAQSGAPGRGYIVERAVAAVLEELVRLRVGQARARGAHVLVHVAVRDEQVEVAVVVEVSEFPAPRQEIHPFATNS